MARVVEVNLKAGQKVHAGDVLIRLDDTDLRARLQQAKATVSAAEAAYAQATADEKRYAQLVASRTVSQQQYDNSVTARQTAEANLRRAQAAVHEAQATLDYATIDSPIDGTVIDKKVDVGDMVTPGQPLVTLYDPTHMQLVASVRESLTSRLQVGQQIGVRVEGLDKTVQRNDQRDRARGPIGQPHVSSESHRALSAGHLLRHVRPHPDPAGQGEGVGHSPPRRPRGRATRTGRGRRRTKQTSRRAIRTGRALSEDEVKMFPDKLLPGRAVCHRAFRPERRRAGRAASRRN